MVGFVESMLRDRSSASPSQIRTGLVLAALFLGLMVLFFMYYDPYRDVASDILVGGNFEQTPLAQSATKPSKHWQAFGASISWQLHGGVDSSGGMRLETGSGLGSSLRYAIDDPRRYQFLRVEGRLRSERIVVGQQKWNTARLLLFFTDRDGQPHWDHPHVVCTLTGTQPWQHCTGVFSVPEFAVSAQVRVQNAASSGTLWVDEVRLTPATEKSFTFLWQVLFAACMSGILAYCVWTSRLPYQKLGMPMLTIATLIIAGVCTPEPTIERIINHGAQAVYRLVNRDSATPSSAPPPGPSAQEAALVQPLLSFETINVLKKGAHFVLFGVLAFLAFSSAMRRRPRGASASHSGAVFLNVAAALLLFAAGTEIVQFLTATRTPSLFDWAIDAGAILLGATIAL